MQISNSTPLYGASTFSEGSGMLRILKHRRTACALSFAPLENVMSYIKDIEACHIRSFFLNRNHMYRTLAMMTRRRYKDDNDFPLKRRASRSPECACNDTRNNPPSQRDR